MLGGTPSRKRILTNTTVYYSPTPANEKLVKMFRQMPQLEMCGFIRLAEEDADRVIELEGLKGRSAYIWGDGYAHHESYHFTRGADIGGKTNYDGHTDYSIPPYEVNYYNHMAATEEDGIAVLCTSKQWCKGLSLDAFLRCARVLAECFGKISVTVDSDLFMNFPVRKAWIDENGAHPEVVLESIGQLGPKIHMLDIGGLVEEIPDFELLPMDRIIIPKFSEVLEFIDNSSGFGGPATKRIFNRVGTYATMVYARVLEIFAVNGTEVWYETEQSREITFIQ